MELSNYYNLVECVDRKGVISILKKFKKEGKISYALDGDELNVEDLDLDEDEIDYLCDFFDKNDVFPNLDKEDDDFDDYDDFGDYDDDY
jgi:hypothetical protein